MCCSANQITLGGERIGAKRNGCEEELIVRVAVGVCNGQTGVVCQMKRNKRDAQKAKSDHHFRDNLLRTQINHNKHSDQQAVGLLEQQVESALDPDIYIDHHHHHLNTSTRQQQQQQRQQQQQQQHPLQPPESPKIARMNNGHGAENGSAKRTFRSGGGDLESEENVANEKLKQSLCSRLKWPLIILMSLALITAAILVAIFSFSLLDNEDLCYNQNSPFQQATSYRLFATKTLYTSAFNYLNKPQHSASTSSVIIQPPNNNLIINNYAKSSVEVPEVFSKQDSLESLSQRLTSQESKCKVRQLHFIGRHAARLPNADDSRDINRHIATVQSYIDLAKYHNGQMTSVQQQLPSSLASGDHQQNSRHQSVTNSSNPNKTCSDPLVQYKQWTSFATSPEQGNLLMETGAQETMAIAQRFKSIFPDFFDAKLTKIKIGTTKELRTAQTAVNFLKLFENFALDFCKLDKFPTENTSDKAKASEIQNDHCFKTFINQFIMDKLSLHKQCKNLHQETTPINHGFDIRNPNRTEFIASSVSRKLKLSKEHQLSSEQTRAIYDACRYETALLGSNSIWCNLFTERDFKFYEFLNDIDDYFNQAYGHPDLSRSACPITTELIQSFKAASRGQATKPEAHFYFTHSQVIQRLLAASVDLGSDPEYRPKMVLSYLNKGQAPKSRQWQTSLFTPFSANLAFILYECPRGASSDESYEGNSPIATLNVGSTFKVVASLNEQPIMLDGCKDYTCDLVQLLDEGRLNAEKKCNMKDICRSEVVVT